MNLRLAKPVKPIKAPKLRQQKAGLQADEIRQLLDGLDCPLMLELGCNDGGDSQKFVRTVPALELHCIEPDPRPIAQFKAKQWPCSVKLHEIAIGAIDGEMQFWQSSGTTKGAMKADWDLSGSLVKPTGHLRKSPWCTFDQQIMVPVRRLDSFWEDRLGCRRIDFLWMDVQGAEADVFAGGVEALQRVRFLYTEFNSWKEQLYEGALTLEQTQQTLGEGWALLGIFEGYNALFKNRNIRPLD